jgi:hypothetical protein
MGKIRNALDSVLHNDVNPASRASDDTSSDAETALPADAADEESAVDGEEEAGGREKRRARARLSATSLYEHRKFEKFKRGA